jgi:serine/threonine-protein kinase
MGKRFHTLARGLTAPVGAYETLLELGRGGMGSALLARALGAGGFERLVVIKRLHPHLLELPDAVQRFLDEASLAACVQHANVVGTTQVGSDEDGYFLVLEYIEGGTLEELIDRSALRGERIPPPVVLRIALDALAGLSAIHHARAPSGKPLSILHRDVTLQNVMVGRDGVARIADFGIAKSAIASVSTDRNYLVGKLLYMPPEYLRRAPVGPTLDIYALGVTLWLALTARELWPEASEAQLVHHIVEDHIPPLSSAGIAIAPQIEQVVARACAPEASARFPTARQMADAIEDIGRNTGWIASHAEVADFVEGLMGVDLARRRERVASLMSRPVTAAHSDADEAAPRAAEPRRRLGWAVAGALAVAGAGVIAWSVHRAPRGAPAQSASAQPETRTTTAERAADQRVAPPAAPESAVAGAPPAVSSATTGASPSGQAPPSEPTPHAERHAAPARPGATTGGPVAPPTHITKKNPYR